MAKKKLKFDRNNFRKHSEENKAMIRKSLEECGAGRSVVVDANDELIAGNGVYEQAEALGLGVRVVETDGTELVVVKRTDLHTDDEKRKRLALADNATADKVEWDFDALAKGVSAEDLAAFKIDMEDMELTKEERETIRQYSRKIQPPTYEPTGEKIDVKTLADATKASELMREIDEIGGGMSEDVRAFLKMAAMRHVVFDYERIADYYSNASAEVQRLMERSALVIIDFGDAIRNGYVTLEKKMRDEYESEHGSLE